jgi:hypothetical protein
MLSDIRLISKRYLSEFSHAPQPIDLGLNGAAMVVGFSPRLHSANCQRNLRTLACADHTDGGVTPSELSIR